MRRGHFLRPLGLRHHLCSLRDATRFSLRFPGRQGFLSCSGRPLSLSAAHCAPSRCGIPSCGDDHLDPSSGMLGSILLYGLPASFGGVTPLHVAAPMLRSDVRIFRRLSGSFAGALLRCGPLRVTARPVFLASHDPVFCGHTKLRLVCCVVNTLHPTPGT